MTRKYKKGKTRKGGVGIIKTPTKRCCNGATHFASRMKYCESNLHTIASYIGSPKTLDFAYTRGIDPQNISDARVHENIQSTDHAPISINVCGVRVISWNIEGLCKNAIREDSVKQNVNELINMFPFEPVIFLLQELFLQKDLKDVSGIETKAIERMRGLLPEYQLNSDGYTGGVAIPPSIEHSGISYIDRPDGSGKRCTFINKVRYNDSIPFNIVNIHLKSIVLYPITGKTIQKQEMRNIISYTNGKGPTLFMGDFNTDNPELLW